MKMERTITLGQLFQIKRERLCLNIEEAAKQIGVSVTALICAEKQSRKTNPKTKNKIKNFYKISEQDMLIVKENYHREEDRNNFHNIYGLLQERCKNLKEWNPVGSIMDRIKKEAIEESEKALVSLQNVLFLDEIL